MQMPEFVQLELFECDGGVHTSPVLYLACVTKPLQALKWLQSAGCSGLLDCLGYH